MYKRQASEEGKKNAPPTWIRPSSALVDAGVCVVIPLRYVPKTISWHRRGDYFVTVCSGASTPASVAISIHTVSTVSYTHLTLPTICSV